MAHRGLVRSGRAIRRADGALSLSTEGDIPGLFIHQAHVYVDGAHVETRRLPLLDRRLRRAVLAMRRAWLRAVAHRRR